MVFFGLKPIFGTPFQQPATAWDGASREASGGDAGADGQAEIGVPWDGAELDWKSMGATLQ
jgi:hypothetical protein